MITSSKWRPRNSAGRLRVTIHRTRPAQIAFATEPGVRLLTTSARPLAPSARAAAEDYVHEDAVPEFDEDGKQQLIQALVIDILWERPSQADGGGALQIAMNGGLSDRATAGDLLLFEAELEA